MKTLKTALVPRTWWGRNAGLRPRLVLIVGIAMLAPGALAVLQATPATQQHAHSSSRTSAQAAQLAGKRRRVNVISASREILDEPRRPS